MLDQVAAVDHQACRSEQLVPVDLPVALQEAAKATDTHPGCVCGGVRCGAALYGLGPLKLLPDLSGMNHHDSIQQPRARAYTGTHQDLTGASLFLTIKV